MKKNMAVVTSPFLFPNKAILCEMPVEEKLKLKKDGTPKNVKSNKKRGRKSEVYPFEIEDIKKMINYFSKHEMWQCYLIFILSCNMARRIGDTLSLTWEHIFNPQTGKMRADLLEIIEDKTDKIANPRINSACRKAIEYYIQMTGLEPSDNNYKNYVFVQTSGNYKGRPLTADGYRKAMKKAAVEIGIEYNIGTHSPRKTFGKLSRMLHPGDYDSMEILQTIYNHSDTKTTKSYIGLTKKKMDLYYDDMGCFFDEYVTGDKRFEGQEATPIVSLDINDLRDIITDVYKLGQNNYNIEDSSIHIKAINEIMKLIDRLKK